MLLLVVLLAQADVAFPSHDGHSSSLGNVPELHRVWEKLDSACRKLPQDSPEGEAACLRREVLGLELARLGWCASYVGLELKWQMCPGWAGKR
jgi:hypothetical protein